MKFLQLTIIALLFGCISHAQYVVSVAGVSSKVFSDSCGYLGDGGPALHALLYGSSGMCRDNTGNLYICDTRNYRIRKIAVATGIITTVAGGGTLTGSNIPATSAALNYCYGVCVDKNENLYIVDGTKSVLHKVNLSSGIITTIAGTGSAIFSGDGGPATAAGLYAPLDVCLDTAGNIYIADGGPGASGHIRKINAVTGIINSVAGTGSGFGGDGGPATAAGIAPNGVLVDNSGNIYIAEMRNARIREVNASTGIINTIVGTDVSGNFGDGGPATAAELNTPSRTILDKDGNLYISDGDNLNIRKVNLATGIISTYAGNYPSTAVNSGDNGPADSAAMAPYGMCIDSCGNLFFTDAHTCRIRVITPSLPAHLCGFPNEVPEITPLVADFKLYPNPAASAITVQCPEGQYSYTITDMLGRRVCRGNLGSTSQTIPLSLPPGPYIFNAYLNEERVFNTLFIKQ